MTYTNKTTFSFELEVRNERQGGVDVHTMERGLRDRGITGYRVDRDGSGCTEITPAPMAFGDKVPVIGFDLNIERIKQLNANHDNTNESFYYC